MRPDTVLSPLGCQLRDWSINARDTTRPNAFARGVILDLDDTLYPHEAFVHSGLMAVARHVEETKAVAAMDAFAVMTSARRQGGGRELQALCARFGWDEQDVPGLLAVYRGHLPNLRLPRATADVLARLREDGWRTVVLTNGMPLVQRGKVKALGLGPLVDAVVYADEHATGGKPAAAAFRAAMNALGLAARQCVCVGDDTACDIAGARAQGIRTVWLDAGSGHGDSAWTDRSTDRSGRTVTPDARMASITELPLLLAQLSMVTTDAA
jgi:putative hydrolase of the HAD superfamily